MPYQDGLYYYAYHPEDQDRTPLVLVHGAGGDHLHWPVQIRRLSGYRVYALDLPGHGKSRGHGLQDVGDYAQVVISWLNEMGIPKVIMIGHSMGSAIALWLGIHYPERLWGLGLIGSGPTLPVNLTLLDEVGHKTTFPDAVNKIIKWSFSPHTDRGLIETAQDRMLDIRPSVLQGDFLACEEFDVRDRLDRIEVPVEIICGGDDKMVPLRLSQQLAEGIPEAELEIIPKAGHMLMIERPEALVGAIRPFIEKILERS